MRPPWNGMGGSGRGRDLAVDTGTSLIPILSAAHDSLFVARRSLRDLAHDERARVWEATIHAARMRAVMEAHDCRGLPSTGPQDVSRRIEQLLLMRAGHLVDDLSPSNNDVMEWLRRIEDGRANLELDSLRDGLTAPAPDVTLEGDRAVIAILRAVAEATISPTTRGTRPRSSRAVISPARPVCKPEHRGEANAERLAGPPRAPSR